MNLLLTIHNRCSFQLYRKCFLEVCTYNGVLANKGALETNKNSSKFKPVGLGLSFLNTSSISYKESSFSDRIKHDLSVIKNVDFRQLKCVPVPASLYGFGGIIPFVFPPLYFILVSYSPFLATANLIYGASILAFVGGVKWGNALAKDDISHEQIGLSTVPSLVAWLSLLVPEPAGFLIVSSGLVGALYIDLVSSKYPPWFCALRTTLTSIATISLLTSFLFNVFH